MSIRGLLSGSVQYTRSFFNGCEWGLNGLYNGAKTYEGISSKIEGAWHSAKNSWNGSAMNKSLEGGIFPAIIDGTSYLTGISNFRNIENVYKDRNIKVDTIDNTGKRIQYQEKDTRGSTRRRFDQVTEFGIGAGKAVTALMYVGGSVMNLSKNQSDLWISKTASGVAAATNWTFSTVFQGGYYAVSGAAKAAMSVGLAGTVKATALAVGMHHAALHIAQVGDSKSVTGKVKHLVQAGFWLGFGISTATANISWESASPTTTN